jgi:hypothetical protein
MQYQRICRYCYNFRYFTKLCNTNGSVVIATILDISLSYYEITTDPLVLHATVILTFLYT